MTLNNIKIQILWAFDHESNAIQSSDGGEEYCMLCKKEHDNIQMYMQKYGSENMMNKIILQQQHFCLHENFLNRKKKRKADEISTSVAV